MKDKEMQSKIQRAFAHAVPDTLDTVLRDCAAPGGNGIPISEPKKTNRWIKRVAAAAAALVLLAGGVTGYLVYSGRYAVASTVSLDVNPSIELQVNRQERVLAATARNEDGQKIMGEMDFVGSQLDVAINALVGSMLRNGYLSELANSILISVDNEDPAAAAALQQKLTEEVSQLMEANTFEGAVLSQTVSADEELQQLAQTYGITVGKARLIQQITASNPLYAFADLAPLSINELNLLSTSGSTGLEAVESVGTASDKAYIGHEKARDAALQDAGVTAAQASGLEVEMDYDDGLMVYEVEFRANGREYEYEVNALSGEIVRRNNEVDDDTRPTTQPTQTGATTSGGAASSGSTTTGQTTAGSAAAYIGEDKAKSIALERAGVTAEAIREYRIELERENGRMVYEVEFEAGGFEYQYEIDAAAGTVLHEDKEWDDDAQARPTTTTGTSTASTASAAYIGVERARSIALERAGVAAGDIREYQIELERDDGRVFYEVEFKAGGYEYQYAIDAASGTILHQEKERDD